MKNKIILVCIGCLIIMMGCIKEAEVVDHSQPPSPSTAPTQTPTPIPPRKEVGCTYTIKKGDTISEIAERFYGTTSHL